MKKTVFFLLMTVFFFLFKKEYIFAYTYEKTIPPVEVPADIERKPPQGLESSQSKAKKYYSNDIKNTANQFICPINFTIQETFPPTPCRDKKTGNIIPDCFIPYDVFAIHQKLELKNLSNPEYRYASAGTFALHPNTNPNPTPGQENQNFTRLDQNGYGIAYRATSVDQQLYLKGKYIEDAVLSTKQQKDTPVMDEQLAWDCSGTCKNLFNEDGSKPSGCRAVHVSEVACFFNNKINQSTSYKWEEGKPIRIPFPQVNLLAGCSAPLPQKCYETLYNDMPFIPRGTVDTLLPIYNKKGGAFIQPTPFDKGFPLMAPMDSDQMAYIAQIAIPANQKIEKTSPSSICDNLKKQDPIQDKPSPLEWESFSIDKYFGTVYKVARTFKDDLKAEAIFPQTLINNIDIDKTFLKNLLPASASAQFESKIKEESSTADEPGFTYPDPGYKDAKLMEEVTKWFTPIEWQKSQQ